MRSKEVVPIVHARDHMFQFQKRWSTGESAKTTASLRVSRREAQALFALPSVTIFCCGKTRKREKDPIGE